MVLGHTFISTLFLRITFYFVLLFKNVGQVLYQVKGISFFYLFYFYTKKYEKV